MTLRRWRDGVEGIARFLGRASTCLGRVPSLLYIVAYLIIICAFSGAFYVLPGRPFYHATAQYEYDALNKDASHLLQEIHDAIGIGLRSYYNSDKPTIRGWTVDISALSVTALSVRDFPERISFHLAVPVAFVDSIQGRVESYGPRVVSVSLQGRLVIGDDVYLQVEDAPHALGPIGNIPAEPNLREILPSSGPFTIPALRISSALYRDIVGLGQGYLGFPARLRGQYGRMLYLSAGIATSTALGDIVPLTAAARWLVTVEALFALVIVGLFLNALAVRISTRGPAAR